jgi:hypothetical protein
MIYASCIRIYALCIYDVKVFLVRLKNTLVSLTTSPGNPIVKVDKKFKTPNILKCGMPPERRIAR